MNEGFTEQEMLGISETGVEANVGGQSAEKNHVPEGSDAFRSVMKELHICDTTSTLSDTDHRYLYDSLDSDSEEESPVHFFTNRQSRKVKMSSCLSDHCDRKGGRSCNSPHRVQWADECGDKTSAKEPQCHKTNTRRKSSPKPILKHRVNCVIIVSD